MCAQVDPTWPCNPTGRGTEHPTGSADPLLARPSATAPRRRTAVLPGEDGDRSPFHALLEAVRSVHDVTAASVLLADGRCQDIPGVPAHALLHSRSAVVAAARERVSGPAISCLFLWPTDGPGAHAGHLQVVVLTAPATATPPAVALVLLSPAGDLHGLTARELEVLGLVVEGACNQKIADALVIALRTVATHLEHILAKLGTPTRTLAAVRAEQQGLYVPWDPTIRGRPGLREPRPPDSGRSSGDGPHQRHPPQFRTSS